MSGITYTQEYDKKRQEKVRRRYQAEIDQLYELGFKDLCFYAEGLPPLSVILYLPFLVIMLSKGEVITLYGMLQFAGLYLLLSHTEQATIALPMGMGVKYYCSFDDDSFLITTSFPSQAQPAPGSKISKFFDPSGIPAAWKLHQQKIGSFVKAGRKLDQRVNFQKYVYASYCEEGRRDMYEKSIH